MGDDVSYQEQLSRLQLDPEIKHQYLDSLLGLMPIIQAYQQQALEASNQLQTGALPTAPSALTRSIISMGRQGMLEAEAAKRRGLAGLDPRTAKLLSGQLAARTTLAANPLTLQAMENQQARDLQARQATNQAIIQQNALRAAPMQAQMNLIQQLGQGGQLTGLTRQFQRSGETDKGIDHYLDPYVGQRGPLLFPGRPGIAGRLRGPREEYKA